MSCLWYFLNNKSYGDTVITAVNLGGDTDTIGALAGGLAGIYYEYEGIPGNGCSRSSKSMK